jgi:hypothetical protein
MVRSCGCGCKSELKKELRNHERGPLILLIDKHEQWRPPDAEIA